MFKRFEPLSNVIKSIVCRSLSLTSSTYSQYRNSVKLSYHIDDLDENETLEFSASPPLLVIHGLFGAKQNWHTLSKILAKKTGKKVITVDARNHGNSEHSDRMDYELMKEDILRLMDELWLDSAVLIGHSMGGKIAMTTALSTPDRVEALVVVDVSPTISPAGTQLLEFAKRMKQCKLEQGKPLSANRHIVEEDLSLVVESKMVRKFLITNLVERNGRIQWRLNLDAIISNYNNILGFPQLLTPFEKETLFIGGSLSHHISEETKPQIQRLFPRARIEHVLAAGHWVHTENPTEFLRILLKFLEEIS
ncbi:protein ABHD11-like [Gigantopelta aegis]|uniref:protein ABHD11-like n=1 Tax=Gigantopelta aegis TaxID=1735272 RepID=UPI001B88A3B9|nr:protein ABHD11-like [Gigantopelta aegis]